jgi:hypothetical protein
VCPSIPLSSLIFSAVVLLLPVACSNGAALIFGRWPYRVFYRWPSLPPPSMSPRRCISFSFHLPRRNAHSDSPRYPRTPTAALAVPSPPGRIKLRLQIIIARPSSAISPLFVV